MRQDSHLYRVSMARYWQGRLQGWSLSSRPGAALCWVQLVPADSTMDLPQDTAEPSKQARGASGNAPCKKGTWTPHHMAVKTGRERCNNPANTGARRRMGRCWSRGSSAACGRDRARADIRHCSKWTFPEGNYSLWRAHSGAGSPARNCRAVEVP